MTPPPTGVSPAGTIADAGSPSTAPPPAGVVLPPLPGDAVAGAPGANPAPGATATMAPAIVATAAPPTPARAEPRDERGHAETTAGAGFWIQLGAFKQRDGALDYQHRLLDEAPWLAPLMAVFADHGLNKLQAGPYRSRDDARSAAERVRATLQLVPTIVEKR
jgi:rare lipoprotein A